MIGDKIINLDTVDSSNRYLKNLVKNQQVEEGTLVLAKEQTAGRGQQNNVWISSFNQNLLISYVLYPSFLLAEQQFVISQTVALGIYDLLSEHLEDVKIKWPNDIYVNDLKIAGVLIENSLTGANIDNTIVGIGLNVNQTSFSKSVPNPTAMKLEANREFDTQYILLELCKKLDFWYNKLINGNNSLIDESYKLALYKFGENCQYKDENGLFRAKITDIDNIGRLCLLDKNGNERKYAFKEVAFVN